MTLLDDTRFEDLACLRRSMSNLDNKRGTRALVRESARELRQEIWEAYAPPQWQEGCVHHTGKNKKPWPVGLNVRHLRWVLTHVREIETVLPLTQEAVKAYNRARSFLHPTVYMGDLAIPTALHWVRPRPDTYPSYPIKLTDGFFTIALGFRAARLSGPFEQALDELTDLYRRYRLSGVPEYGSFAESWDAFDRSVRTALQETLSPLGAIALHRCLTMTRDERRTEPLTEDMLPPNPFRALAQLQQQTGISVAGWDPATSDRTVALFP